MDRIEFDGTVTIDERTYVGKQLEIKDGVFLIDGKCVKIAASDAPIHLTIQGHVRGNITGAESVTVEHGCVHGNVTVKDGGKVTLRSRFPADVIPSGDWEDVAFDCTH